MPVFEVNLLAGWIGTILGVVTGALIGLFFHQPEWLGGYGSWPRRLVRLGHISFFGLAFLNFMFAFTDRCVVLAPMPELIASRALLMGALAMPTVCFLSAWRKPYRHLFFIPVTSVLVGLVAVLVAWPWKGGA